MTPRIAIPVELFLERGCRSSALVLEAVYDAADSIMLDIRVLFRDRDAMAFSNRAVIICPATFIDGKLAFYGVMTSEEFLLFIHTHIPQHSLSGEIV